MALFKVPAIFPLACFLCLWFACEWSFATEHDIDVIGVEIEFSNSSQGSISLVGPYDGTEYIPDGHLAQVKKRESLIIDALQKTEPSGEYLITTYSVKLDNKYLWRRIDTETYLLAQDTNSDRNLVSDELPLVWSLITKVGTSLDRYEYSGGIRCENEFLPIEAGDYLDLAPKQRTYQLRVERGDLMVAASGLAAIPRQVRGNSRNGHEGQRIDISRKSLAKDSVRVFKQGSRRELCGVHNLPKDANTGGYFHFEISTRCLSLRNMNFPGITGMVTYMQRNDNLPGCLNLPTDLSSQISATDNAQRLPRSPDQEISTDSQNESQAFSHNQGIIIWLLGILIALAAVGIALLTLLILKSLKPRQYLTGAETKSQTTREQSATLDGSASEQEAGFRQLSENQEKFQQGLEAGLNRVFERIQKDSGEAKQGVIDILDAFRSLQNALDAKDKEIDRLRQGYDLEIYRRFVGRFIRLEKVIAEDMADIEAGKHDARETLEDIRTLLEDALEDSGLKRHYPSVGTDIRDADGVDGYKEQRPAETEEQVLTIAEVLEPGWKLDAPGGPVFLKKARVVVYVKPTSSND